MSLRFATTTRTMIVTGLSAVSCSVTGIAYWRLRRLQQQEKEREARLTLQFQVQAAAMSKDLILGVLRSDQCLRLVTALLLQACRHPEFKKELSAFLKYVFVEDPRGSAALKKFVVDDVILDPWVRDNLLALVSGLGKDVMNDRRVWPDQTLELLKGGALDAIVTDRFNDELWDAVSRSLRGIFSSW